MKLAVASDLHLEFGSLEMKNPGVDVLILSGDITTANTVHDESSFFDMVANEFPHVVYVMGNHEHYHYDFAKTAKTLKEALDQYPNIHLLDNEYWDLHDARFIGGTLWTDMNKNNEYTIRTVKRNMNDFRCVKNSNRMVRHKVPIYKKDENGNVLEEKTSAGYKLPIVDHYEYREREGTFSPEDAIEDHEKMLSFLGQTLENTPADMKVVVVGHHAPSKASTHPRYLHETIMNGAYSSDLSELILDHPQITLWTHGHTHEDFDYMIGSTRIVCNPRGYVGYESRADSFKLKVVEL